MSIYHRNIPNQFVRSGMAPPPMDAVTSFTHLVDNIPQWLEQLRELSAYTKKKNLEFVAEYARVKAVKPKRLKSPSISSIQTNKTRSTHLPHVDPVTDSTGLICDLPQVDPLEAGNRHLYADQAAQRKRKSSTSLRSNASGPQKFRSKHQVVIHYDAHVQDQLDTMVKTVGVARNNLRKGKNALTASRGFRLPNLSKRYDSLTSPSLENIASMSKYRSSGLSPNGPKFSLRQGSRQPQDSDEVAFLDSDKVLEQVQSLYETAAHQFLRDGDCLKELDNAERKLTGLVESARSAAEKLQEKVKQQAADEAAENASPADESQQQRTSDQDCPSLTDNSSIDPVSLLPETTGKSAELSALTQTLEGMKTKGVTSDGTRATSTIPQAGMTIEVDDSSDAGSVDEIDISQFRSANRLRLRS